MKTTVDIADDLLLRSQSLAKREGSTLRALLEEGLRLVLAQRQVHRARKLNLPTFGKGGLTAEFQDAGWSSVRDTIYGSEDGSSS